MSCDLNAPVKGRGRKGRKSVGARVGDGEEAVLKNEGQRGGGKKAYL